MSWENVKNFNLSDLDFNDIGNWPIAARIVLLIILSAAILFAGYWFDTKDQIEALQNEQRTEIDLKSTFERKQAQAANLQAYKDQLETIKRSFGAMLRQLPDKTEVADLLVDVSQAGLASGLEFNLFQPGAEVKREFYAELPINVSVVGSYHQFGEFVSALAALPRIVTLHDVNISGSNKSLSMSATAKTYRYLDEGR